MCVTGCSDKFVLKNSSKMNSIVVIFNDKTSVIVLIMSYILVVATVLYLGGSVTDIKMLTLNLVENYERFFHA